jgi:hypothetical protein
MARRIVAGAEVEIDYRRATGDYAGVVTLAQPPGHAPIVMAFSRLKPPKWGLPAGPTSPEAYDEMALLAVPWAMRGSGMRVGKGEREALCALAVKRVRASKRMHAG